MRVPILLAAIVGLAACGGEQTAVPTPLTPEQSAALAPSDPHIAGLYEQSCKSCHTVKDTGAPLAGDRTQWDQRWAKGEDALLASTVQGLNGMPAGGQCFACTPEEYKQLIAFMAGRD